MTFGSQGFWKGNCFFGKQFAKTILFQKRGGFSTIPKTVSPNTLYMAWNSCSAGGSAAAAALAGTKKRAQPDPPQQGVDAGQHGFRSVRKGPSGAFARSNPASPMSSPLVDARAAIGYRHAGHAIEPHFLFASFSRISVVS